MQLCKKCNGVRSEDRVVHLVNSFLPLIIIHGFKKFSVSKICILSMDVLQLLFYFDIFEMSKFSHERIIFLLKNFL
jgi:hypothetical protein